MSKPLKIFGTPEQNAVEQIEECLEHPAAVAGALMADNHLGYAMPIGGVVAYDDAISPTGVGFDIGCGNKCVRTDLKLDEIGDIKPIMREIQKSVAFGMGRNREGDLDHDLFYSPAWDTLDREFGQSLKAKARNQLGTVGAGNHYVDLLVDQDEIVWVANHFGSRGLGHTICSGFMAYAAGLNFTDRVPEAGGVVFQASTPVGEFYIEAMKLAGEYAYAGRDYVISQVLDILQAPAPSMTVHNHHNFAWKENGLWVVRKGATPLTPEPAFIGGSMGDISVIVKGKTFADVFPMIGERYSLVEDLGNLGSAPHGAGRVMSRTKAAGKFRKFWVCNTRDCDWRLRSTGVDPVPTVCPKCGNTKKFRKLRLRDPETAAIDWDAVRPTLDAVVLGAGADESPGVYKDLATVLNAHPNIEVLHELHPVGVVMASPDTHDPYKD